MSASDVYPLFGGCDCRTVRYSMDSRPLFVLLPLPLCQRETGASFALNAMIETDRGRCMRRA
jgi:hypothetical protein